MTTKYPLAKLYSKSFAQVNGGLSRLANFFLRTLNVPNCTWEHIVEEIRAFKSGNSINLDRVVELYKGLADMRLIGISAGSLK
jgi:hypothetical protein